MNNIMMQDNMQSDFNLVKEVLVSALVREGYLASDKADEFLKRYAIITHKRGWLGRKFEHFFNNESEQTTKISVVKLV